MTTTRLGFVTCGLSLVMLGVTRVAAQTTPGEPDTPQVRTAATVQRSVQPDLGTVTLEFTAVGATPSEAGARLAARADSLRRALGTLGIPRDSLVNRSRWYWWRGRIEVVLGPVRYVQRAAPAPDGRRQDMFQDTTYRAHDAIEVRIHDLSKVGAVLDTALGRRITDISDVRFSASDVSAAQEDGAAGGPGAPAGGGNRRRRWSTTRARTLAQHAGGGRQVLPVGVRRLGSGRNRRSGRENFDRCRAPYGDGFRHRVRPLGAGAQALTVPHAISLRR
jgi:hypothetical protein